MAHRCSGSSSQLARESLLMVALVGVANLMTLVGQELLRQVLYFFQNELSSRWSECPATKTGRVCPVVDCQQIVQPLVVIIVVTFAVAALVLLVVGFLIGYWYGTPGKDARHPRRRGGGILVDGGPR